jgi:hypothetical protein
MLEIQKFPAQVTGEDVPPDSDLLIQGLPIVSEGHKMAG